MSPAPLALTPLALTMGEPAGVGGEIALKAWARRTGLPPFFIIDDAARLAALAKRFGIDCPVAPIASAAEADGVFSRALPVLPLAVPLPPVTLGEPSAATARAVVGAIDQAVDLVTSGAASGMVTNPIQKATLQNSGFAFPGHTEYLGHLAGGADAVMMLLIEGLKVVPVTVHVAIKDVASALTTEAIIHCGRVTAAALQRDFGVARPHLAVAALNPHAGEKGKMGGEESSVIAPAIAALRADGIEVSGPSPADTLFHAAARRGYDAAICMYHDQALIPLKTLDFAGGVNMTLGLPFVRTSPDHGTACDIAARGIADPSSLISALKVAGAVAARRTAAL
ncbi:MAG: 4-hydroxythreonine-4-phosphate dehydrogenase PdxA [Rhodospirillaceae bacterium]|nr:4-hydroxythreonine-4-phosphate dehydrogenase PdxA [Rhodospirillaceae bacterium]